MLAHSPPRASDSHLLVSVACLPIVHISQKMRLASPRAWQIQCTSAAFVCVAHMTSSCLALLLQREPVDVAVPRHLRGRTAIRRQGLPHCCPPSQPAPDAPAVLCAKPVGHVHNVVQQPAARGRQHRLPAAFADVAVDSPLPVQKQQGVVEVRLWRSAGDVKLDKQGLRWRRVGAHPLWRDDGGHLVAELPRQDVVQHLDLVRGLLRVGRLLELLHLPPQHLRACRACRLRRGICRARRARRSAGSRMRPAADSQSYRRGASAGSRRRG